MTIGTARNTRSVDAMIVREQIANRKKHWVRAVTACNSKCLFCLDADTPRNLYLDVDTVKAELLRGREELDADKVIISGGEASLHPKFPDFIRYAKEIGYDRVQTVTNGTQFADKDFYERCIQAGLGEITYSLHGDTPKLHDYLTQTPGCFRKLMKALIRSVRDRRLITNVDVVINKQNVAVIDKIVELAISVGVTEFDLLHVIPQSNAYRNRDEMFYDVREHLPVLQKVFRLNRHPRFHIWTNRFPVSYLEGLEDLIQDPHKMLDEVNGRRFQVRRYLDEGKPLDCRTPDRCEHCFIEPFCTTTERVIERQNANAWHTWDLGDQVPTDKRALILPFGCTHVGLSVDSAADLLDLELPDGAGLTLRTLDIPSWSSLMRLAPQVVIIATTTAQLEGWLNGTPIPDQARLHIELNQDTAKWLLAHPARLETGGLDRVQVDQPSHEQLTAAHAHDVRDPAAFFRQLNLPIASSGLPACLAPGTRLVPPPATLSADLFDPETGRIQVRPLARHHIADHYKGKSVRCEDCTVTAWCAGVPINMIRDQGLALAQPLIDGEWAESAAAQLQAQDQRPPQRIRDGMPPQPVANSLDGFAAPSAAPRDPLAIAAGEMAKKQAKRDARRAASRAKLDTAETQR
jgi:MoaA/NifB/PqqE/SkfB family radical SAM enzyme